MRLSGAMLYTILICLFASQISFAESYKIQVGAFVKKIPFTYFAFSGINDVYLSTDADKIYRYYLRTTYKDYQRAIQIKNTLVNRGFENAIVITFADKDVNSKNLLDPIKSCAIIKTDTAAFNNSSVVYFKFDKFNLTKIARNKLIEFIKQVKSNPRSQIFLIGHTDAKGDKEYNVELSKNRVRTVKSFLIQNGIVKERIILRACGESKPLLSNVCEVGFDQPQHRKLNRRVVILAFDKEGQILTTPEVKTQKIHPVLER